MRARRHLRRRHAIGLDSRHDDFHCFSISLHSASHMYGRRERCTPSDAFGEEQRAISGVTVMADSHSHMTHACMPRLQDAYKK